MEIERPAANALIAAAFAYLGLWLPDWDMRILGEHRSALTHSVLPVAAIAPLRTPALTAGLALGVAIHLSADIFTHGMHGFSTIKLPFFGSIGVLGTYIWLAANLLGCAAAARSELGLIFDAAERRALLAAALVLAVWYVVRHRENPATLGAAGGAFGAHRIGRLRGAWTNWRGS